MDVILFWVLVIPCAGLLIWNACMWGKIKKNDRRIREAFEWTEGHFARSWKVDGLSRDIDYCKQQHKVGDEKVAAMERYLGIQFSTEPEKKVYRKKNAKK